MTPYPPDRHLLRDLRLSFDDSGEGSRAWLPVVPELCGDDGALRAGALATLVDVIGGGLAASDCPTELDRDRGPHAPPHGRRDRRRGRSARARSCARAARRSCSRSRCDAAEASIGVATMSFSVLPRRAENPDIAATRPAGPSTMALEASGLDAPLFDLVGIETVDAGRGIVELPVREWAMNSMGALQGGVVGAVVEAAGEVALRHASGTPLVVTDLQITYLSFGRVGPLRTETQVLTCTPDHGVARVALFDTGAESRQMSVGRVVATRSLT